MSKKRLNRKGTGREVYKFLIKILIILVIAGILYFMIRRIGNAFTPT